MASFNDWQKKIWFALVEADGKSVNINEILKNHTPIVKGYEIEDFFEYLKDKKYARGKDTGEVRITPDGKEHHSNVIDELLSSSSSGSVEQSQFDRITTADIDEVIRSKDFEHHSFEVRESDNQIAIIFNKESGLFFKIEFDFNLGNYTVQYKFILNNPEENFISPDKKEILDLFQNWLDPLKSYGKKTSDFNDDFGSDFGSGFSSGFSKSNEDSGSKPLSFYVVRENGEFNIKNLGSWLNELSSERLNSININDVILLVSDNDLLVSVGIVTAGIREKSSTAIKWYDLSHVEKSDGILEINIADIITLYKGFDFFELNSEKSINEIFSFIPNMAGVIQSHINEINSEDFQIENEAGTDIISEPSTDVLGTTVIAELFYQMIDRSSRSNKTELGRKWDWMPKWLKNILFRLRWKSHETIDTKEEQFYGIFGQWGRGKTYFWSIIKKLIEKDSDKFIPIEFHAWKYQDTPAIWVYLFETFAKRYYRKPHSILSMGKYLVYRWRIVWLNYHRKGSWIFLLPALMLFTIIFFGITFQSDFSFNGTTMEQWLPEFGLVGAFILTIVSFYKTIKKSSITSAKSYLKKITEKVSFAQHLGIQHEIQKEIISLLNAWIGHTDKKLMLFVDDIDRCDQRKIIDIVDSIRVMLEEPKISNQLVVLAAIDERILEHAIKVKYDHIRVKDEGDLKDITREYMDKLFIACIKLHPLTSEEKKLVLKGFLGDRVKKFSDNQSKDSTTQGNSTNEPLKRKENFEFIWDRQTINIRLSEAQYQLTIAEYNELEKLIEDYEKASPRVIRSIGIRYRLGKNIISKLIANDKELLREWHDPEFNSKKYFAKYLVKKIKGQEYKPIDLSEGLAAKVSNTLEMVVPY